MVHVFSGPDDQVDGLAAYLSKLGVPCVDLDITAKIHTKILRFWNLSQEDLIYRAWIFRKSTRVK